MSDSSIGKGWMRKLFSKIDCADTLPQPLPGCFGLRSGKGSKSLFSWIFSSDLEPIFDLKDDSTIRKRNSYRNERTSYFGAKQLKLYNMELDPFEINDVSDANIEIVNFLLVKMADYYVSLYGKFSPY